MAGRKSTKDKKAEFEKLRESQRQAAEAQTQTAAAEAKEVQSFDDIDTYKGNVRKKEYQQANVEVRNAPEGEIEIPEADIEKPVVDMADVSASGESPEPATEKEQAPASSPEDDMPDDPRLQDEGNSRKSKIENPALNDLDKKDKKNAAKDLAKVVLDGYGWMNEQLYSLMIISEAKIERKITRGKFDADALFVEFPSISGQTVRCGELIEDYNRNIMDVFDIERETEKYVWDDEFRKDIEPRLVRIFEKKGAGLTDEQYIMYKVFMNITPKITAIAQLQRSINFIMKNSMAHLNEQRKQSGREPVGGKRVIDIRPPAEQPKEEQESQQPEQATVIQEQQPAEPVMDESNAYVGTDKDM